MDGPSIFHSGGGGLVSSPDTPPTRGKERLVAIDTTLSPMTSLSFHMSVWVWSGQEPSSDWSESSHVKPFRDLIGDINFEIAMVLRPRNASTPLSK